MKLALTAVASYLIAMASNLIAMAPDPRAMASNITAMASNLIAVASFLPNTKRGQKAKSEAGCKDPYNCVFPCFLFSCVLMTSLG